MALSLPTDLDLRGSSDLELLRKLLEQARHGYYEDPAAALAEALRCHEIGRSLGDSGLCASACALQGVVSMHRGDLTGAFALAVEAEGRAEESGEETAQSEVAALKAQLSFFTGSYVEALRHAERSVQLADATGDLALRVYARRATCPVFGNSAVHDLGERIDELLALAIEFGSRWEEAITRNDIACYLQQEGDLAGAEREIDRALQVALALETPNSFLLAVVYSTRADIRLMLGLAGEALADAERSIELLIGGGDPNPYVLGMTVRADIEARMALGRLDDARRFGEGALRWLGDQVPQTRSLILSTLATVLREAGRLDEAYDALAESAELERQAFRELSELQLRLERATLETSAARRASDELVAKNRQLADAHTELASRAHKLEALQDQLRDQADRDWLTGLHNRRYLARELERLATAQLTGAFSLAVIDLDHFKSINDRFGHQVGDQVLIRVAGLLCDVLRKSDIVVRSGGEEFLVLMPLTEARAATVCCERIRETLRDEMWEHVAAGLAVTTSVGVASTEDPGDLEALVRLADQRLYEAKHSGRDRVVSEVNWPSARPVAPPRGGAAARARPGA